MLELAVGAALLAGLAGSGHCLAMCGGMAGLLSAQRNENGKPVRRTLIYNAGRITSYSLAGMLAGLLGHGLATGLGVAAAPLRVASGMIIVFAGLYLLTGRKIFAPLEKLGERFWRVLSPLAVRQLRNHGAFSVFPLGMLWGWLPCGMTWSILAIAAASTTPASGAVVMAAFGIGTLPALVGAGLAGMKFRSLLNRVAWRRSAAVILIAAGTWTAAFPLAMNHLAPSQSQHIH